MSEVVRENAAKRVTRTGAVVAEYRSIPAQRPARIRRRVTAAFAAARRLKEKRSRS
jgi:hypothetical protein